MARRSSTNPTTEPFPPIDQNASTELTQVPSGNGSPNVKNRSAASSSLSGRLRRMSASFEQSELPEGFFAATGGIASSLLTRQSAPRPVSNSIGSSRTQAPSSSGDAATASTPVQPVIEEVHMEHSHESSHESSHDSSSVTQPIPKAVAEPPATAPFPNGYHFPPKHSFAESTKLGGLAFWNYILTPVGFVVTIYGLNVVAWGGMLFLLLCNAAPAMCHPTCDDINSPRRIWVEIDSQILNALFCVTGFGLAPWRFRDLYFLLQYRLMGKEQALRQLAGIHRGWFRLQGSNDLPISLGPHNVEEAAYQPFSRSAMPFPAKKVPAAPLTGVRARPTRGWKLDLVVWLMVSNTFLQCVLCGFMWGMNRYNRPSWATGLFVGLGCGVAAIGGFIMFLEGKAVKGIEGVPISQQDVERLQRDREHGIYHYNNIKDKDLEAKEKKNKATS